MFVRPATLAKRFSILGLAGMLAFDESRCAVRFGFDEQKIAPATRKLRQGKGRDEGGYSCCGGSGFCRAEWIDEHV